MSTPEHPAISIVIPAYNEARRLPPNLPKVVEACEALHLPGGYEVRVMVEGSTDGTLDACRAASADCPNVLVMDNGPRFGKGHAVRSGMLQARGDIVFFMDADLSTPLSEMDKFLARFDAYPEVDVLIGNRRHPDSCIGRPQGLLRRTLSPLFSRLVHTAIALPGSWSDTQCGFKAFRAAAAREIFRRQRLDGFSFDVEVLALAGGLGLRVEDMPVAWFDADATRLRLLRDGWEMLRDLRRVRPLVARSLREQPPGAPIARM